MVRVECCPQVTALSSTSTPLLLYADPSAVVIDKPAGLLVHTSAWAGPPETTVLDLVRARYGRDLHPVHRLDRQTSGVLLFARGGDAVARWQASLSAPDADKRYLALVRGCLSRPVDIDHPLSDDDGTPRDARSSVEPLCSRDGEARCSLVRVRIHTGRTHQVRRHLKHLSHPVLGDANYGKGALNRWYRERFDLPRLGLHARGLSVTHPFDGTELRVCAEVPDDLSRCLDALFGEAWSAALRAVEAAELLPRTPATRRGV